MSPKQKKIIIISAIVLILLSGGMLYYYFFSTKSDSNKTNNKSTKKQETPTTKIKEVAKPVLAESQLDGTMVAPDVATRHPLAVMIENHAQARPQSGLTEASIVYETLAEGGITRFMAIFGTKYPTQAGPVRSARSYYVSWAEEYDAFYAHFGGATDALAKIAADGVKDLDGMKLGKPLYWRTYYPGVSGSEHTAFTSPEKLFNYAISTKKWSNTAPESVYKFKDDPAVAERGKGGTVTVNFSGNANFIAKFTYDPATNTWPRAMAGVSHKDRITGAQIAPKNVIVQYTNQIPTNDAKNHLNVVTSGSGQAKYFIDGKMIEGTWSKSGKSRTIFKDAAGSQIILDRGQTWIAVVSTSAPVTWVPTP